MLNMMFMLVRYVHSDYEWIVPGMIAKAMSSYTVLVHTRYSVTYTQVPDFGCQLELELRTLANFSYKLRSFNSQAIVP